MEKLESAMKSSTLLNTQSNLLRKSLIVQPPGIQQEVTPQTQMKNIIPPTTQTSPKDNTRTQVNNTTIPTAQTTDQNFEQIEPPQPKFTSSWAKQVAEQLTQAANSLTEGKLKPKYRTTKDIDKAIEERNLKVQPEGSKGTKWRQTGMKSIKKWFGDDTTDDDSSESDNDSMNNEWDGTIDRTKKNTEKKKDNN